MNSCVLMATIISNPELRYTQEGQTALSSMLVEFPGSRPEDPPATIKVIGWGNLATEISNSYSVGDQVILEGRVNINSIERTEGGKEKKAELTVSKIYALGKAMNNKSIRSNVPVEPSNVVQFKPQTPATPSQRTYIDTESSAREYSPSPQPAPMNFGSIPNNDDETDLDDIPF